MSTKEEDPVSAMVNAIHPYLEARNARPIPHASRGIAPTELWGIRINEDIIGALFGRDEKTIALVRMAEQLILSDFVFRLDNPEWYSVLSDDGVSPSEKLITAIGKVVGMVSWYLESYNAS